MFSGPAWMRRRIASASSVVSAYVTSSGPKHCSHTYRASSGYGVRHSLHVRDSGGICDLRVRVGCSEADASPSHISQVALGYLLELAPFPRHEPSVSRDGCRGFTGPVPPPLSMRTAMSAAQDT